MKKKLPSRVDSTDVLIQIQEQLAVLNNKLDDFINKSLTDLAETLAIQKAAAAQRQAQATNHAAARPAQQPNARAMFAIVCFQCGKDSELPFKPASGRPVYCPECFAARRAGNFPKVSQESKPSVEVQAPVELKVPEPTLVEPKRKTPVATKAAVKKTTVKKAAAKKTVVKKAKKKSAGR